MSDASSPFFSSPGKGHFHKTIALHEHPELSWDELILEAPLLPRGWFELSRLSVEDRIEFTQEFWMMKLPFLGEEQCALEVRLVDFFSRLDELEIYLTQQAPSTPFEVHMIYGFKEPRVFFHGSPPASRESILNVCKQFGNFHLPSDYLAFLEIHDGFSKYTDTGLIKTKDLAKTYLRFQQLIGEEVLMGPEGDGINPTQLIPFYESYELHCYQCFFADWYPYKEMGNIFFHEEDKRFSDYLHKEFWEEHGAFPTFLDWLVTYLEES